MITGPSVHVESPAPRLGEGVYTLPDTARLLGVSGAKLRNWVSGYLRTKAEASERRRPAGTLQARGRGREKTFGFLTLIEILMIAQLRQLGVSMRTIRQAREELSKEFGTAYPFAMEGILTDRKAILKSLGNDALLELGKNGVLSLESIVAPLCLRLDFDGVTHLAERFYPDGRESPVVVDPQRSFGRPVVGHTGIATEAIASLIRGGETVEDVAIHFDLAPGDVQKVWEFEQRMAA